jgi:hypothetical protein
MFVLEGSDDGLHIKTDKSSFFLQNTGNKCTTSGSAHLSIYVQSICIVRTIVKTTLVTDNINCVPSLVLHTQYSL